MTLVSEGRIVSPESKFLATLWLTLAVVMDPALPLWRIVIYFAYLKVLMLVLGVPLPRVVKRSLFFLPFLAVIVLFGILPTGNSELALLLLGKGWLAALALAVLGLSGDFPDLIKGLRRLGLPAVLALLLTFMYRYLELLLSEAKRMETARNQRYFGGRYLQQFRILGNLIGSLFIRTFERGERVYQAMLLRGYTGYHQVEKVAYSGFDLVVALTGIALVAIVGVEIWVY